MYIYLKKQQNSSQYIHWTSFTILSITMSNRSCQT